MVPVPYDAGKADVWALGISLLAVATGFLPFSLAMAVPSDKRFGVWEQAWADVAALAAATGAAAPPAGEAPPAAEVVHAGPAVCDTPPMGLSPSGRQGGSGRLGGRPSLLSADLSGAATTAATTTTAVPPASSASTGAVAPPPALPPMLPPAALLPLTQTLLSLCWPASPDDGSDSRFSCRDAPALDSDPGSDSDATPMPSAAPWATRVAPSGFLLGLVAHMLHPDPQQRWDMAGVVGHMNAWLARTQPHEDPEPAVVQLSPAPLRACSSFKFALTPPPRPPAAV